MFDFLSVHIARTDRPNEDGIAALAKRKHLSRLQWFQSNPVAAKSMI
jgi:hypothetical protein